jgi:hypothetical protein
MRELLPIALGVLVGAGVTRAGVARRTKLLMFVAGCLAAGALASWINGELASEVWALFVSFDALQAWLGAAVYMAALLVLDRRSLPSNGVHITRPRRRG